MPKALPVIDMSAPVCCAPVAAGPISDADALQVAMRLKALADPATKKKIEELGGEILVRRGDCARHQHPCPGIRPHLDTPRTQRLLDSIDRTAPDLFERIQGMRRIVYDSEDYREGLRAFREKRKPKFSGK